MVNAQLHTSPSWRARWPQWVGYATALWSLLYGLLGLYWTFGGGGFPFGHENDPAAMESYLEAVQRGSGAPVIAALGLLGTLVALTMTRTQGRGLLRGLLLTIAWLLAVALLIVIPDRRILMAVAYAPLFVVGAPFGWPPISFLEAIPWPVINQFILMVGGALWVGTALSYQRRTQEACANCGRTAERGGWTSTEVVVRWSKWAVGVAFIVPIIYAATRWAWALGIPLGISEEFLRQGQAEGVWIAGAGLATVAVGGAILTLGLIQRWGEIFPRWMIGLAGKRVPPALAIVPALFVSVIVTSAGLAYVRIAIIHGDILTHWTTIGPELLWPLWGVALAAATLGYYLRRRWTLQVLWSGIDN